MKYQALIIEDNHSDQILHKAILEALGFECTLSDDGENAIGHLVNRRFDLIILDLNMPKITGIQVLMGVRQAPLAAEVPVVVVSARDDLNSRMLTRMFGARAFIRKPLNVVTHEKILRDCMTEGPDGGFYE